MIDLRKYDKATRADLAAAFNAMITSKYENKISKCITNSVIYSADEIMKVVPREIIDKAKTRSTSKIFLVSTDTVSCLFNYASRHRGGTAILNFASFKHPGGMFLSGSSAQEESLCHQSILYPILCGFTDSYYAPHMRSLNRGLYQHEAIYTKGVLFFDINVTEINNGEKRQFKYETRGKKTADVITCAAPNATVFLRRKYGNDWMRHTNDEELAQTFNGRVKTILNAALYGGKRNLIFGAFGCGVFGNDPDLVARIFLRYFPFSSYDGCFDNIYFAIPKFSKSDVNYIAFREVIDEFTTYEFLNGTIIDEKG